MEEKVLFHYGIKGTKWGVRNGPPYPLPYEAHNAAERKANPKSILDNYGSTKFTKTTKVKIEKNTSGSKSDKKLVSKRRNSNPNANIEKGGLSGKGLPTPSSTQTKEKKANDNPWRKLKDPEISIRQLDVAKAKSEASDVYDSALAEYEKLSETEKNSLFADYNIKSAEAYARYKLKEYLKETYGIEDDQTSELINDVEESIYNEMKDTVLEGYADWVKEYDTVSDEQKEEWKNSKEYPIRNAEQYADWIAMMAISENSGYTEEEAAAMVKKIKKERDKSMSHSDKTVLVHHGILGMHWGVRRYQNEDGTLTEAGKRRYGSDRYPWGPGAGADNNSSTPSQSSDTVQIKRSANVKEATAKSKYMTNDELRKSAERLELENRYIRAVQNQQGKTFMENLSSKANTVANLMNSTNSITQFVTGKNFAQLLAGKGKEDLLKTKVEDLEMENRYYTALSKKRKRDMDSGKFLDWDSIIDDWTAEFDKKGK